MPQTLVFDTLAYAKRLKAVGFTEEQAEVQAETLAELLDDQLATKRDIKELEVKITKVESTLKRDIKELETAFKRDMKELELRLTVRLGVMMAASIAIIAALVKLL